MVKENLITGRRLMNEINSDNSHFERASGVRKWPGKWRQYLEKILLTENKIFFMKNEILLFSSVFLWITDSVKRVQ